MLTMSTLRALGCALLQTLSPRTCAACNSEHLENNDVFCAACGHIAAVSPLCFDGVPLVAAGRYESPLREAVHRLKFRGAWEIAGSLAELMAPGLQALACEPGDLWIPVPLHKSRLVERAYNQSALLARALSRKTSGRFAPWALRKARITPRQLTLNREQRLENLTHAFVPNPWVAEKRVILVDDVVTTGATLGACMAVLRAARAHVVGIAVLSIAL
jgi:ComF family protein